MIHEIIASDLATQFNKRFSKVHVNILRSQIITLLDYGFSIQDIKRVVREKCIKQTKPLRITGALSIKMFPKLHDQCVYDEVNSQYEHEEKYREYLKQEQQEQ